VLRTILLAVTSCCGIYIPACSIPLILRLSTAFTMLLGRSSKHGNLRDKERDGERQDVLRKLIMDDTGITTIEFDALYDKVLADMPQSLPAFTTFKRL
jgi:hypothetical protein